MARIILILGFITLGGCSTAPVNAWDRGDLARTDMQWQPDPLQSSLHDHIHNAKEAAAGGIGTGGGGCGCY